MTTILTNDLLTKIVVYWPPGAVDKNGERATGTPVEKQCHWEDRKEELIDAQGKQYISTATVYLNEPVAIGGWLWLSSKTIGYVAGSAITEAPDTPPNNLIIRSMMKMPDIDNDETLYQANL